MKDKLTKQDKVFVKSIVKTGNGTRSVLKAYPNIKSVDVAGNKGHRLLRKAKIQKAIMSIADSIPDKLLIEKHKALLNKEEVITKNNMTTGEVEIIPTGQIDTQAVKAGLDMAYKIKGTYANVKIDLQFSPKEDLKEYE